MADEDKGGATPPADPPKGAAPPAGGEAHTDDKTPPPAPPATGSGAGEGDLGDAGKRALDAERKARREAEARATAAEAEAKKFKDAQLSNEERLQTRVAELEKRDADRERVIQEERVRRATATESARLGFADPDDAWKLLDPSELEFEQDGTPKNVRPLLEALLKAKPYLASAAARASGSIDQGVRGARSSLTVEEIKRMTPEETEKRWPEIQAFLASGGGARA